MFRDTRRPVKAWKMPSNPKPKLETHHLPVFRVHHKKLEAYIERVFGFEFDFLFAVGITEGTGVDYRVTGKLDTIALHERATDLRGGRRARDAGFILNVLAHDGYIPTGHYCVVTHKLPNPTNEYTDLLHKTRDPNSDECRRFKESHRNDTVFTQRAATLDALMLTQLSQ